MDVVLRIVAGTLVVAHGLIHLMWFLPNDDPAWPFRLDRSRLLPDELRKPVATVLVALVVAGFALLGLAVWGVPGLAAIWPVPAIGAATASIAVLVLFWDRQLVLGVAIDLAIIAIALWQPGWTDRLG